MRGVDAAVVVVVVVVVVDDTGATRAATAPVAGELALDCDASVASCLRRSRRRLESETGMCAHENKVANTQIMSHDVWIVHKKKDGDVGSTAKKNK